MKTILIALFVLLWLAALAFLTTESAAGRWINGRVVCSFVPAETPR